MKLIRLSALLARLSRDGVPGVRRISTIVREIQLQREVDFHDNFIRFYGVTSTTSSIEIQRKEYLLVMEYADNGTLRKYLKGSCIVICTLIMC
ncbi:unnamed protein product [Rhizophagus irregularis]|uniref:Protein kinase domain-containing protein n=1 Tax=Rhizophagus irregularis TaxID=588596 RepID=A0A915YVL2_9GLOM|nr:unnamed protein product [Rhizophagus irregularis]